MILAYYRSMVHRFASFALVFVAVGSLAGCSDDPDNPPDAPTGAAFPQASSHCVDVINEYRASIGLNAYERWADAEECSDDEAKSDSETGTAHGAFGQCGESAQNECPGWNGAPETMIDGCLEMMWAEGPGEDFSQHGHYINMSSTGYTKVACGFFVTSNGSVWSVQNFK
jgi:Cysteine-rich secretory protein family